MERWQTVQDKLTEFRRSLAPDFPCLEIVEGYDYQWKYGPTYKTALKTKRYAPCGVYLHYSESGELLYVGKADWFYKRMLQHDDILERRYIDLICFPSELSPFVLALEAFLLRELRPRYNFMGTNRKRQCKEEAPTPCG